MRSKFSILPRIVTMSGLWAVNSNVTLFFSDRFWKKVVAYMKKCVKIDVCAQGRANKVNNVNDIRTDLSVKNSQKNIQTKVLFRRN